MNWTALLPLVGVLVGWVLTQASTWITTRQADKRVLRETLFFLLELHSQLSKIERLETLFPEFQKQILQRMVDVPEEIRAALGQRIYSVIRATFSSLIGQRLEELKVSYNACLLKLSAVDPINAYLLSGQESVIQRLPQMVEAMQQASSSLNANMPTGPQLTDFMRTHLEDDAIKDAARTVYRIANDIAFRIDIQTSEQLTATWAKNKRESDKLPAQFQDFADKIFAAAQRGELE